MEREHAAIQFEADEIAALLSSYQDLPAGEPEAALESCKAGLVAIQGLNGSLKAELKAEQQLLLRDTQVNAQHETRTEMPPSHRDIAQRILETRAEIGEWTNKLRQLDEELDVEIANSLHDPLGRGEGIQRFETQKTQADFVDLEL
eukprot:TRINITY_DN21285_c0_g2_i1.p2 TRINITY_DN21285_c0_g2~~TRINITY_DN21285_c0_g2_i1.p2  ORF type:complete len:146 (-),score=38.64 TRINITY_DN21285_c0_g2_i1:107-544(-)